MLHRRTLFLGLVGLGSLFIFLLRPEKPATDPSAGEPFAGLVKSYKSFPTKALHPPELRVEDATVSVSKTAAGLEARHALSIVNTGEIAFQGVMIRVEYSNQSGQVLEMRNHYQEIQVSPGRTVRIDDWAELNLPKATVRGATRIHYGDLQMKSDEVGNAN